MEPGIVFLAHHLSPAQSSMRTVPTYLPKVPMRMVCAGGCHHQLNWNNPIRFALVPRHTHSHERRYSSAWVALCISLLLALLIRTNERKNAFAAAPGGRGPVLAKGLRGWLRASATTPGVCLRVTHRHQSSLCSHVVQLHEDRALSSNDDIKPIIGHGPRSSCRSCRTAAAPDPAAAGPSVCIERLGGSKFKLSCLSPNLHNLERLIRHARLHIAAAGRKPTFTISARIPTRQRFICFF
jgi:hypothetical protein